MASAVKPWDRARPGRGGGSSAARARRGTGKEPPPRRSKGTMSTLASPVPLPARETLRRDPAAQAFLIMRIAFTVAPILFALDKFANVLTDDWTRYLAPQFNDLIPGSAAQAMPLVGIVEIVAGVV